MFVGRERELKKLNDMYQSNHCRKEENCSRIWRNTIIFFLNPVLMMR